MVKYWYRLRREAKAHPVKAAVLVGMCVTAIYYWAPILQRWTRGDTSPQVAVLSVSRRQPAPNPARPATAALASLDWRALLADARHPWWRATRDPIALDPFRPFETDAPAAQDATFEQSPERPSAVDPATAGLRLQATAVGTHRCTAVIDGCAYGVGDVVGLDPRSRDEQGGGYRVVAIGTDHVVLEQHGERFELVLEPPPRGRTRLGVSDLQGTR